jgi:hypothetical protein
MDGNAISIDGSTGISSRRAGVGYGIPQGRRAAQFIEFTEPSDDEKQLK